MIKFHDPVYDIEYYFVSDNVNKHENKVFGSKEIKEHYEGCFLLEESTAMIYVKGFKIDAEKLGTLAHEVNHAVDYVLVDRGVRCSEAKSYYAGYLITTIIDEYKKLAKKNKAQNKK